MKSNLECVLLKIKWNKNINLVVLFKKFFYWIWEFLGEVLGILRFRKDSERRNRENLYKKRLKRGDNF